MWTRHVSGKLATYVDGELTPQAAQQVESHLEKCAPCRTECDRIRSGMAMVERLPIIEAPDSIPDRAASVISAGVRGTWRLR